MIQILQFKFRVLNFSFFLDLDELSESSGPGFAGIPTRLLKRIASLIAPFLSTLINMCLINGEIPSDRKIALITPLYPLYTKIREMKMT